MRAKSRRLHMEYGLDLIVVDYLQLMSGGGRFENRVQEVSFISRQLKVLARELNVPVLAAAQLSRAVEQRADKHPLLSDLRESGSIEMDADVVMFLYRSEQLETNNLVDVIVAKHRNGPTGTVQLVFQSELARFENPATI
jgi:replicative DNA helicase